MNSSKAYLAISKSNRPFFDEVVDSLHAVFSGHNTSLHVFVDSYNFDPSQEKEMMTKAFDEIDQSDILIAEVSKKAIGVGIEVGYAFAKGKRIIYLRKKGMPYSTTVAGCAGQIIEYADVTELENKLNACL